MVRRPSWTIHGVEGIHGVALAKVRFYRSVHGHRTRPGVYFRRRSSERVTREASRAELRSARFESRCRRALASSHVSQFAMRRASMALRECRP